MTVVKAMTEGIMICLLSLPRGWGRSDFEIPGAACGEESVGE